MKRRGGSLSVSSLRFYSAAARCPLWQKRIMRREEGKYQRGMRMKRVRKGKKKTPESKGRRHRV